MRNTTNSSSSAQRPQQDRHKDHHQNHNTAGWNDYAPLDAYHQVQIQMYAQSELDMQHMALNQPWMAVTIIDDDDLMFGGKALSTWYEEDRRRYSTGDENGSTHSLGSYVEDEELHRGRSRDRPQYQRPEPKHKKSDSSESEASEASQKQ